MGENTWVWWVLAAVVLLLVVAVVISLRQRRSKARTRAGTLRGQAGAGEHTIDDHEASAKEMRDAAAVARQEANERQAEADRADGRARALEDRAEQAVLSARGERDEQTEAYLEADDVDPDTKR